MKVLGHPLNRLSSDARLFPVHLLREGDTGLCLFAAAFLGVNDAIHMARMNMTATCVDIDGKRLREMEGMYPDDWEFVHSDAWQFAVQARADGREWDTVSVDTFTGSVSDLALASLEMWCLLATRTVVITLPHLARYHTPAGWQAATMNRSELASWLILTRT